jgi:uncharacterized protein YndB with AHSA1/START domain
VSIERRFDAPPDAVWAAWTEPSRFAEWFGTPPFRTPVETVSMDVRPGGRWQATQVSEDGATEMPFLGTYDEVRRPERLVFTFDDPEGGTEVETATLTLRPSDGGTLMEFSQEGHLPEEQYGLLAEGYCRFFDRLEEHLRKM